MTNSILFGNTIAYDRFKSFERETTSPFKSLQVSPPCGGKRRFGQEYKNWSRRSTSLESVSDHRQPHKTVV